MYLCVCVDAFAQFSYYLLKNYTLINIMRCNVWRSRFKTVNMHFYTHRERHEANCSLYIYTKYVCMRLLVCVCIYEKTIFLLLFSSSKASFMLCIYSNANTNRARQFNCDCRFCLFDFQFSGFFFIVLSGAFSVYASEGKCTRKTKKCT